MPGLADFDLDGKTWTGDGKFGQGKEEATAEGPR